MSLAILDVTFPLDESCTNPSCRNAIPAKVPAKIVLYPKDADCGAGDACCSLSCADAVVRIYREQTYALSALYQGVPPLAHFLNDLATVVAGYPLPDNAR